MTQARDKKLNRVIRVLISVCTVILIISFFGILQLVNDIQGTARVVNYAGLVRGTTHFGLRIIFCQRGCLIADCEELLALGDNTGVFVALCSDGEITRLYTAKENGDNTSQLIINKRIVKRDTDTSQYDYSYYTVSSGRLGRLMAVGPDTKIFIVPDDAAGRTSARLRVYSLSTPNQSHHQPLYPKPHPHMYII